MLLFIQKNKKVSLGLFIMTVALTLSVFSNKEKRLKQIANEYKGYYLHRYLREKDTTTLQWSVADCAVPDATNTITLYHHIDSFAYSKAKLKSPHGDKLYKLYIKDTASYFNKLVKEQPIGQVVLKETWTAFEIKDTSSYKGDYASRSNGRWFSPLASSELFIMYKEKESAGNDKGWVYGIVDIKNKKTKVLTAGRISSCIGCHKGTKYDRLFGIE